MHTYQTSIATCKENKLRREILLFDGLTKKGMEIFCRFSFLVEMCVPIWEYTIYQVVVCMQDGEEIRSQDGYCLKCAEWTDTDQVVFFFFFAIIAHHLLLLLAVVSRRSHLRSAAAAAAAALCALQIQNPPPHNTIHRFRRNRHQEQDQKDNKNKW
jgi:hypothetical protein